MTCVAGTGTIVKPSVHAADAVPAVLTRVALNCAGEFVSHTSQ
jgi:hypothetical protein